MTMTKTDIAERIYQKVDLTTAKTSEVVDCVFDIMKETLQVEDKVKISGFGNFVAKNKRVRRGRNPQTGEPMDISSRRILTFKPSHILKTRMNAIQE